MTRSRKITFGTIFVPTGKTSFYFEILSSGGCSSWKALGLLAPSLNEYCTDLLVDHMIQGCAAI